MALGHLDRGSAAGGGIAEDAVAVGRVGRTVDAIVDAAGVLDGAKNAKRIKRKRECFRKTGVWS